MTSSAEESVANAHAWFEVNSGWAPPDLDTLAEWTADGVSRCPDECLVAPDGWCRHGLASWWLILRSLDEAVPAWTAPPSGPDPDLVPHPSRLDPRRDDYEAIMTAHRAAVDAGEPGYVDPATSLYVMTARYHLDRGSCCDQGCRHCPYLAR